MTTKPATRKLSAAELATAKEVLLRLVENHSDQILEADDGEVKRMLVAEAADYSVALHAHEVEA